MQELFKKIKHIAIIGLSPNPTKDSHQVAIFLKNHGFHIIPIYPKEDMILQQKVYQSYMQAQQEEQIDCVVVFRKSQACLDIAQEIIANPPLPLLVCFQLGIVHQDASTLLQSKGITTLQDTCIKILYQHYHD